MANPSVPLEWLYETLNKRVGQGIKLKDLFLCVPFQEEAEFNFELEIYWSNKWRNQGNDMQRDYPNLHKILGHSRKDSTIKVFFIHPSRLQVNLILWHKKYPYPKISKVKSPLSLRSLSIN